MKPTILICTPDHRSRRFEQCLASVTETCAGVDHEVVIFDNRCDPEFSHSRAINRALSIAGDALVTLDDDVVVQGDWLAQMLDAARGDVGIVTCSVYRDATRLNSRAWTCDRDGRPKNWRGEITDPVYVPAACSCCMLIRPNVAQAACASGSAAVPLRASTDYAKYYFDPDLCLSAWEYGVKVVTVPAPIIHKGAGYTQESGQDVKGLLAHDRSLFRERWLDSGRLRALRNKYESLWPETLTW